MKYQTLTLGVFLATALPAPAQEDASSPRTGAKTTNTSIDTDRVTKITIRTTSEIARDDVMRINGEERDGGRFGGGGSGQPEKIATVLDFDEGRNADGSVWREYRDAKANTQGMRRGEVSESEIESMFHGKRVLFVEADDGMQAFENDREGTEFDKRALRNVPMTVDVAGLLPEGKLAEGEEVAFGAPFRRSVASLVHPIRPMPEQNEADRPPGGRGGDARPPTDGGEPAGEGRPEGADRGRRGRGQRGGGEGWRRNRTARGANDVALTMLANDKLDWKGTGKVVKVDAGIAYVEFQIGVAGEGSLEEIGMGGPAPGGRGGRGGGATPEGDGTVSIALTGSMQIDVAASAVRTFEIGGRLDSATEVLMVRERNGEEMEIERDSKVTGTLRVAATFATAAREDD